MSPEDLKKNMKWLDQYVRLRNEIELRKNDLRLVGKPDIHFNEEDIKNKENELDILQNILQKETELLTEAVSQEDFLLKKIIEYYYIRNIDIKNIARILKYSESHIKSMKRKAITEMNLGR